MPVKIFFLMWGLSSGTFIRRPQYLVLTCSLSLEPWVSTGRFLPPGSHFWMSRPGREEAPLPSRGWRPEMRLSALRRVGRPGELPCPRWPPGPRLLKLPLLRALLAVFKSSPPCLSNPTLLRDSPKNWTNQDKECDPEKKFHLWGCRSRGMSAKKQSMETLWWLTFTLVHWINIYMSSAWC